MAELRFQDDSTVDPRLGQTANISLYDKRTQAEPRSI